MAIIYLAIGANVGDKKQNILKTVVLLQEKITDILLAPIYETKPWGFKNQDNFLNTALKGKTKLSSEELLTFIKNIEKKIGRITRFKNGPREIDIDILFYDDLIYKKNNLEIPHPGIKKRDFVLQPLADISPDFIHPLFKKTSKQLLDELPKKENIIRTIED